MYFISPEIYIKHGGIKGMGVYAKNDIPANTMLELSPVSSCWKSNWEETPYHLKKIVFSFPMNTDNYVIVLGYISVYNHDDNNNVYWFSCDVGVGIITRREIKKDEEICVSYGTSYWLNGWTKY
jgi:SET domain-containing protein